MVKLEYYKGYTIRFKKEIMQYSNTGAPLWYWVDAIVVRGPVKKFVGKKIGSGETKAEALEFAKETIQKIIAAGY